MAKNKNSWNEFFWSITANQIFQRQQKIYQARVKGDKSRVYFLQTKLLNSNVIKLFTTQIVINKFIKYKFKNQRIICLISPRIWYKLIVNIKINGKAISFMRLNWIQKLNTKNNLGIHTILSICKQIRVEIILKPEWERKLMKNDQNNYSNCIIKDHLETLRQIQKFLQYPIFIVEVCIFKNLNQINCDTLFQKIEVTPQVYNYIKLLLESSDFHEKHFFNKIFSSIYLMIIMIYNHGFEQVLKEKINLQTKASYSNNQSIIKLFKLKKLGYIQTFGKKIIIVPNIRTRKWRFEIYFQWNKNFELKSSKKQVHILHTLEEIEDLTGEFTNPGFNYMGLHFKHFRNEKKNVTKDDSNLRVNPFKKKIVYFGQKVHLITAPSKKQIKKYFDKLNFIITVNGIYFSQLTLVKNLNLVIYQWCSYFQNYKCQNNFGQKNLKIFFILKIWCVNQVGTKNSVKKYFNKSSKKRTWTFGIPLISSNERNYELLLHKNFKFQNLVQLKKYTSIFDENWAYWNKNNSIDETYKSKFTYT